MLLVTVEEEGGVREAGGRGGDGREKERNTDR